MRIPVLPTSGEDWEQVGILPPGLLTDQAEILNGRQVNTNGCFLTCCSLHVADPEFRS